jgi:hypothetical protein
MGRRSAAYATGVWDEACLPATLRLRRKVRRSEIRRINRFKTILKQ